MWDNLKEVKVVVPGSMMGKMCGICGNFDGDLSNDLKLGDHTGIPDGSTECDNLMQDGSPLEEVFKDLTKFLLVLKLLLVSLILIEH